MESIIEGVPIKKNNNRRYQNLINTHLKVLIYGRRMEF